MSEEDEAADCKETGHTGKSKVSQVELVKAKLPGTLAVFFFLLLLEVQNQTCQRAVGHRHLLQERPLQQLRARQRDSGLLRDVFLQGEQGLQSG